MKKITFLAFCILFHTVHAQQWEWAKKADSTTAAQVAKKICSDNLGNIFALGYNQGAAIYGNAILDSGSFVVKYDSIGILLWAKKLEGNPIDISCDVAGNLYVLANFNGNMALGSFNLTSMGSSDMYFARISSSGAVGWAKSFGGLKYDEASSFAVDNKGNSYITGLYNDSIQFGNILLKDSTETAYSNFFLLKIDSTGNIQWANSGPQNYASSTNGIYNKGTCVRLNKAQDIYVIGQQVFDDNGFFYYFFMKYNSLGSLELNKNPFGGDWSNFSDKDFVIDDSSNIYHIWNSASHYYKPKLIKYDSLLNIKWQIGLSDGGYYPNFCISSGLSVDDSGNVYVGGILGGAYFQGDSLQLCNQWLVKTGAYDLLIGKFNRTGSCSWYKTAGGKNDDSISNPLTLHVDKKGNCLAMGVYNTFSNIYNDTVSFDNNVLTNDGNWSQVFVAKLKSGIGMLMTSVTQTNVSCNGLCNGTAIATASGGQPPYTFLWTPGGQTTDTKTDMCAGIYTYLITDSGGNSTSRIVTITQPIAIIASASAENINCSINSNTDLLTGIPAGGTFSGIGVSGTNFDPSVAGLGTWIVSYTYTDGNGCSDTATINITVNLSTGVTISEFEGGKLDVYPNPSSGRFTVNLKDKTFETKICVYDVLGNCVFDKVSMKNSNEKIDLTNQPKGIYTLEIESAGESLIKKIVLQ
jgi:hypothetical protein